MHVLATQMSHTPVPFPSPPLRSARDWYCFWEAAFCLQLELPTCLQWSVFYLQLCLETFLLVVMFGSFYTYNRENLLLAIGAFLLRIEVFCLQWKSVFNHQHLNGL